MSEPTLQGHDDTSASSVSELVAHVRLSHHVTSRVLLGRVEVAMVGVGDARRDEGCSALRMRHTFSRMRAELLCHMATEERAVFPYLRAIDAADRRLGHAPVEAFGSASPLRLAIERAVEEDLTTRQIGGLQASCRADLAHDWEPVIVALRELQLDLAEHVRFESEVLFPRGEIVERRVVARAMRL